MIFYAYTSRFFIFDIYRRIGVIHITQALISIFVFTFLLSRFSLCQQHFVCPSLDFPQSSMLSVYYIYRRFSMPHFRQSLSLSFDFRQNESKYRDYFEIISWFHSPRNNMLGDRFYIFRVFHWLWWYWEFSIWLIFTPKIRIPTTPPRTMIYGGMILFSPLHWWRFIDTEYIL